MKAGDRVAEFDATGLTSDLEQKRIAAIEAETELVRFDADREGTILAREQAVLGTNDRRSRRPASTRRSRVELTSRREHEEKQLALKRAETELAKAEEDLASYRTAAAADRATKLIALERARSRARQARDRRRRPHAAGAEGRRLRRRPRTRGSGRSS